MTFEEFTAARLPAVPRFAAALAGDRATAEDLAQEVLTRAYSRRPAIANLMPGFRSYDIRVAPMS
jgi:DNA-directed RNA polymerase specialized sigma24 family protein